MNFFFDNCLPIKLAEAFRCLDVDVEHLREKHKPGIADVDWMPAVAKTGRIAVTADLRILKRPAEREVRRNCGLRTVFFQAIAELSLWDQAHHLVRAWPIVEKWAKKAKAGECARVNVNGKLEVITDP